MVSGYIKGSLSRNEFLADYLTAMDSIGAKEYINELNRRFGLDPFNYQ